MQTTLRAAVMLAVLVGLPAAWVYYGPLPDGAQRVVDRVVASAKVAAGRISAAAGEKSTDDAGAIPRLATELSIDPARAERPLSLAEELEPLLAPLRQMGVEQYALERWGAEGRLYRFRCEASLTPSGQITEQFEAVAPDPRASIARVADEVGAWYVARHAGG